MFIFFFFNDTATTEIYTLSLHDALPIYFLVMPSRYDGWGLVIPEAMASGVPVLGSTEAGATLDLVRERSEEHTSELQSPCNLVCRLLLEKKKNRTRGYTFATRTAHTATF